MATLTRYLAREFCKLLALCQGIFVALYLVVDFLQVVDNFMEAGAPAKSMLLYFIYKTPFILVHMSPVAALISVIVLFSTMERNNEITALKACGLSLARVSLPVVTCSLLLALGVFVFSELVMPYASSRSQGIWYKEVKKRDPERFYGTNHIWYKGTDAIYWIRHFDNRNHRMDGPIFYFFDERFRLIRRVQGKRAVWTGNAWRVEEGEDQRRSPTGEFRTQAFRRLSLDLPEKPQDFLNPVKEPEEMGFWELKRYAEKISHEGYDATRYFVDMHIKLAFPLINMVMVLLGIPIATRRMRGGTPVAVCAGISLCFVYLVFLGLSRSFGISGVLPPVLAAWFANGLFSLFGFYLLIHSRT